MSPFIMKLLVWLAFSQIVSVYCQSQYDYDWDRDGILYLKPTLDLSMCVKTEKLDAEKINLKLISCSTPENSYTGLKRLYLEKSEGYYRRIRAFDYPTSSTSPRYSCFWAGVGENSRVLTDRCDIGNPWHLWNFRPLGGNKIQWVHKQTGNCVRALSMSNGTDLRTLKCNLDDKNQIWEAAFLKEEFKFDDAGKISLKSMLNQGLCLSTQQYDAYYDMNVAPCTTNIEDGDDIELGKVGSGYYQFQSLTTGIYHVRICIGAEATSDKIKMINMNDCNYNDAIQHWAFIETGNIAEVLVYNSAAKKCIQVYDDRKTTRMVPCNFNDIKQIWKIQHA